MGSFGYISTHQKLGPRSRKSLMLKLRAPWLNNAALAKVSGVAVGEAAQTAGIVVRRKKTKG